MNKTFLAIGALIILALGGYLVFSANDGSQSVQNTTHGEDDESTVLHTGEEGVFEEGLSSLKALIARGENLTCDFRHASDDGMISTGKVYISGDNFRVDSLTVDVEQGAYESSMIFQEEVLHAWTKTPEGETFGFTFAATKNDVVENSQDSGVADGSVSLDQEVDFTCRRWSVDVSMFVPPSDVEFFDPSAMFMPQ